MNETTVTASAAGVVQRSKRYKQQSLAFLKHYFRDRVSFASIRAVLEANGHSFAESFRALHSIDMLAKDLPEDQRVPRILQEAPFLSRISPILIKQPRDTQRLRRPTEPTLLDEINDIPELNTKKKARNDTEEEAQDDGKQDEEQDKDGLNAEMMIECGCCYLDFSFDDMCQCNDGHLFCLNCLRSHAEENVFGKGQFQIKCLSMEENCEAGFSDRSLDKAIPDPAMRQRIDEYMMRASLIEAGMNDTSQCPNCAVVGTLPPNQSFVQCPQCDHAYCHHCSEAPHMKKTCKQVKAEKVEKSKTDERNRVADEMTAAVVRDCPGCQKRFFKVEGCNRMKCPSCETLSCYICRQQIENYKHFCQTPHCNHQNCHKCVLFTNSEEDDRRARHEIALKAQENATENQAVAAEIGGLLATPSKTHRRPLMAVRRGPPGDAMDGLGPRQHMQQQYDPLPRRRRRGMAIHPMNQQQQQQQQLEVQREVIVAQPRRQAAPNAAAPQQHPRVDKLNWVFACILVFFVAVSFFYW